MTWYCYNQISTFKTKNELTLSYNTNDMYKHDGIADRISEELHEDIAKCRLIAIKIVSSLCNSIIPGGL